MRRPCRHLAAGRASGHGIAAAAAAPPPRQAGSAGRSDERQRGQRRQPMRPQRAPATGVRSVGAAAASPGSAGPAAASPAAAEPATAGERPATAAAARPFSASRRFSKPRPSEHRLRQGSNHGGRAPASGPLRRRRSAGAAPVRQPSERQPGERPARPAGGPQPGGARTESGQQGSPAGQAESWQGQAMTGPLARPPAEPDRQVPFWLRPIAAEVAAPMDLSPASATTCLRPDRLRASRARRVPAQAGRARRRSARRPPRQRRRSHRSAAHTGRGRPLQRQAARPTSISGCRSPRPGSPPPPRPW